MQTPGFKVQIGSTNIMSLQQKIITPLNQSTSQGTPTMTMLQQGSLAIAGAGDLKRLPSSIKILKPLAPKPPLGNYASTVIKPAQESTIQTTSPGPSSVCHHVLPFGTTIKVTAGNEQLPIAISKPQQIIQGPSLIQQQAQYQPQQAQLPHIQQPQSPSTSTLLKQIRPVSPAAMATQPTTVLSPSQNKVIINKIIYKPPESHLGPNTTAGQTRIVAATPPLSPGSIPDFKRKIIIANNANRSRLSSPGQSPTSIPQRTTTIQPAQAQIIVQAANPTLQLAPALTAARTTIDNIPNAVQTVISTCNSSNITVTPMPIEPSPAPTYPLVHEEKAQSTVDTEAKKSDNVSESSEPAYLSSFEEFHKTVSQSSWTKVDTSETEVSSTTTEQMVGGIEEQEHKDDSHDEEAGEVEDADVQMEMEMLDSSQGSIRSNSLIGNENVDKEECEEKPDDNQPLDLPVGLQTLIKKEEEQITSNEEVLSEEMKSPRLQKRANSDVQHHSSPVRARRLSEPSKQDEVPKENEDAPPMPQPLAVVKRTRNRRSVSRRSRSSKSSVPSSLFCNEKLETESDESRSIKTSASSLHTISPPKKEDASDSPPAYDQDKVQEAIDVYKKKQALVKSHREKNRSESRSVADREEKEEKDFIEGDFGSTPSDLIKWNDGIGYIRGSPLHFQFNQFGLVEPMDIKEYMKHVNTNVYESLKDPLRDRTSVKTARKKRKPQNADGSYHCKGCRGRGTAGDFATPDYCSIACMKKTNNEPLLLSIAHSKDLQRKGIGSESSASNSTPLPTSDDESLGSSLNFANAFKEKRIFPAKESSGPKPVGQDVATTQEVSTPKFSWETYLAKTQSIPSPLNLFVSPYPSVQSKFRVGMKLEAIDPENNSLFCVCTIVEVLGYRLKLTFDGYSRDYDFWVNADSLDIFPPGWCQKTKRILQPPYGYDGDFSWKKYLYKERAMAAPWGLFKHLNLTSNENKFEIGMSLEADDLKKSGKVCVASVTDKIDNRILVHFDGWDERYDYWVDIHSPYIHYIDWHHENGYNITPPPDWNKGEFEWVKYIRLKSRRIGKAIIPADQSLFATRQPMDFKPGMKLEVVDRKNQMLIRPATVVATDGYEIKVCFDGWPNFYSFWIEDDSSDIHPMNWCKRTYHPIEFPPDHRPACIKSTCEVSFCLGKGNAKFLSKQLHNRVAECPYRTNNWLLEDRKKMRLMHEQILTVNNCSTPREPIVQEIPPTKKIKKEPEEPIPTQPERTHQMDPSLIPALRASRPTSTQPSNGSAAPLDPLIKTALPVIADFGPRLKQSYKLWKSTSRILDRCTDGISDYERNPLGWSVEDVASYVERFAGCSMVGNQIREEQINGMAFLSMTQEDLVKYLDVKLGPAIKLYNRIIHLRQQVEQHFIKF